MEKIRRNVLITSAKTIEKSEPPKIIINSFWRSGSTFLLECLSDLFAMRPYFEPIHPREEKFEFIYRRGEAVNSHPALLHDEIGCFQNIMRTCRFKAKWVYKCLSARNVAARNGKILKLANGSHLLHHFPCPDTWTIHLERDVRGVVESFLNSGWTRQFFEGLNLEKFKHAEDEKVKAFYLRHEEYLDLKGCPLEHKVTVYCALTNKFFRRQNAGKNLMIWDYRSFLRDAVRFADEIASKMNIDYSQHDLPRMLKRKSKMTALNKEKTRLGRTRLRDLQSVYDNIMNY